MSSTHQALARTFRPRTFDALVGQDIVVRALTHALDQGRVHHAFLLTGTRGVGKTTIARILAKALNCDRGLSSTPCGTCSACVDIDAGRFVDLIEVDAASRTKVEDTRDLLDNVPYAPSRGRFKVYLIDEVHMLSTHSFNALLKTLEEPPPHVKFILATTDPQKLPITILSRCLQFHLKRLSAPQIAQQLATVLTEEKLPFEPSALGRIARAGEGSMRDALSLLDQAIAFGGGQVTDAAVAEMLGSVDARAVIGLLDGLAAHDAAGVLEQIVQLDTDAPDYAVVLADMLTLLQRVAWAQALPSSVDSGEAVDSAAVQRLATQVSPDTLQLWHQIALIGRRDLPLMPEPRSGFEMILLRMLCFRPVQDGEASVAAHPVASRRAEQPIPGSSASQQGTLPASEQKASSTSLAQREALQDTPAQHWAWLIQQWGLKAMDFMLARQSQLLEITQTHAHLLVEEGAKSLLSPQVEERLRAAFSQHCSRPIQLKITYGTDIPDTPARLQTVVQVQQNDEAHKIINADKHVSDMRTRWDAEVEGVALRKEGA